MIWEDEGYLLSKANYSENSIIVDVFTSNHGRCSGIIYGGSSRKLKKYLQVGNKIHVICKSKSENKLGYFQTELIKAISPLYFNDKKDRKLVNPYWVELFPDELTRPSRHAHLSELEGNCIFQIVFTALLNK